MITHLFLDILILYLLLCDFGYVHKVKNKPKSQQPMYRWCLVLAHMDGLRRFIPFTVFISHTPLLKLSPKQTDVPIKQRACVANKSL